MNVDVNFLVIGKINVVNIKFISIFVDWNMFFMIYM